jgi:hypothetical protein
MDHWGLDFYRDGVVLAQHLRVIQWVIPGAKQPPVILSLVAAANIMGTGQNLGPPRMKRTYKINQNCSLPVHRTIRFNMFNLSP